MSPIWQIELFGGLRGRGESGAEFAPGISRVGMLFACLALAPHRSLSRDYLATLLWPESDATAARTRLRQELSALRRQLEPDGIPEGAVLLRERDRISLLPGAIVTDVERFQAAFTAAHAAKDEGERERMLDEAAALYRGELLPGYDYEGIDTERAGLAHLYEAVLRELAALRQAQGDHRGAEACLRRLIAQNPYLEEAYTDLMRVYAAQGQPTRVREQYRELERTLRKEFDAEPTEATRQLVESLCRDAAVSAPAIPASAPGADVLVETTTCSGAVNGFHPPPSPPVSLPAPPTLGSVRHVAWRIAAAACILLAGLIFLGRYGSAAHPGPPGRATSADLKSRFAPLSPGHASWVYAYSPHPGERLNSEPKAMAFSGKDLFVTGLVETEREDADVLTLKLSPEGRLLRYDRYSGPEHDCDRAFSIAADPRGGVYVAGESYVPGRPGVPEGWRAIVIRYDSNLKRRWVQRSLQITKENGDSGVQVVLDPQDGCWVGATALIKGVKHLLILRYNGNGRLLWSRTAAVESVFSNMVTADDAIYVCGTRMRHDRLGTYNGWLALCLNRDGTQRWQQTIAGPGREGAPGSMILEKTVLYIGGVFHKAERSRNGPGLVLGVAQLAADDGQLLWTQWEETDTANEVVYKGMMADDPGVWLVGRRLYPDHSEHVALVRYDEQGVRLWERQYDAPSGYGNAILSAQNESSRWLGIALTLPRSTDHGYGDLLALDFESDGSNPYAFVFRPMNTDLNGIRAILTTENSGYIAAQSLLASGQTLTVTKFQIR